MVRGLIFVVTGYETVFSIVRLETAARILSLKALHSSMLTCQVYEPFSSNPTVTHGQPLMPQIFVGDPSVLFVSTHQAGSYPGTGRISEAGTGDGAGATINIPLPGAHAAHHKRSELSFG